MFNTPTGSFASPGYPRPYPTPRECAWTINAPIGSRIVLTIDVIDLETHTSCDLESLEVSFCNRLKIDALKFNVNMFKAKYRSLRFIVIDLTYYLT